MGDEIENQAIVVSYEPVTIFPVKCSIASNHSRSVPDSLQ